MRHLGLKIRMAVVGTILFAFYSVAVAVAWYFFGQSQSTLALVIVGSILLVGIQYKVGKWAALKSVGAEQWINSNIQRFTCSSRRSATKRI